MNSKTTPSIKNRKERQVESIEKILDSKKKLPNILNKNITTTTTTTTTSSSNTIPKEKKNLKRKLDEETTIVPSATEIENHTTKSEKKIAIPQHPKKKVISKGEGDEDDEIEIKHEGDQVLVTSDNSKEESEKAPVTFEELGVHPQIAEACYKLGYKAPKEIQRESIPWALKGRDIIGLAQTGSGKTAAFAIPVLEKLLEQPQALFALVMAPTRELAFQIAEQFEALGAIIGVKCCVLVGGIDTMQQSLALAKKPHIVVGTPGKVHYHLENTKGFSLRSIKFLVMDEADRLFSNDFEEEINAILKVIPKERQTFLFSATMTSKVAKLQRASLSNPVRVQVATKYQTVDTLQQKYLLIPYKYKECYLAFILNETAGNSTIIFTSTCASSKKLAILLRNLGFGAIPINGDMDQSKRLASLSKFKQGQKNILVATDVAARGLDIPSVDLVINFDIPQNSKEYIHRVGRTARAGQTGKAIIFVTQYDIECYQRIEYVLGKKLEEYPTQEETVLILLERVNEASRIALNELKEAGDVSSMADDSEESSFKQIKKRKVIKKQHNKKKY
ncbi:putative RNA helicase [Tieghemostelium lacteum]|uniref:Putative RNA helicase n=1 Tax=Tieghemostelium lacteum TaxID=361077 RepID=A0A151ZHW7_TIELA|nr:putative RNA helicase [Tieghemostelium lacteum]|eukprot:KYQ93566.1 putative RNA helicase [Tieghemostelium lacteum]